MANSGSSLEPKLEHLSALHCECIARAKAMSDQSGVRISDEVASFVTENAFRFAQLLATDLESFARHAKRSTINQDDVLLFTRRNPQLQKFLNEKSTAFDVAADGEDADIEMQSVKRRIRQSVKSAKKPLEKHFAMSPLKAYFPCTEMVATPSAVTSPSMTSTKNISLPAEDVPSTPNVPRVTASPLKRALLKSALPSTKTPSSSKTAEVMKISPQKTLEGKDSPVPTALIPTKDDRQQSGVGPIRVSLLDGDDEFSNIFDDFGDV